MDKIYMEFSKDRAQYNTCCTELEIKLPQVIIKNLKDRWERPIGLNLNLLKAPESVIEYNVTRTLPSEARRTFTSLAGHAGFIVNCHYEIFDSIFQYNWDILYALTSGS